MKKENLFIRIAIGFVIGIALGFLAPSFSLSIKFLGDIYLNLIKMMIIPILVCAVAGGIINSSDITALKRIGVKTVILYVIMFLASFAVSFGVAVTIRPGLNVVFENQPVYEGDGPASMSFGEVLTGIVQDNMLKAMLDNAILPTILFTMIIAIAILAAGEKGKVLKDFINSMSAVAFSVLGMIMETSPVGVMALMAFSIAEYGSGIFMAIGKYILCCWLACIAVFIIVFTIPVKLYTGVDLRTYLAACGKVALMTMSTTSSAATLPTTIRVSTEDLGAPASISDFTLPLGCTINMCGGACSFCCISLFVADFYSLDLPLGKLAAMAVVATLINMAAPGIPGGGIVLMTSYLTIFGLPIDLIGPVAAFYRLLDMAFTTINVEGDIAANLIISKSEGLWDPSMVRR
ncbi:MAG: dicarboxylate/amino acid:cation symporter [Mogibacterium sp.]|jgi:Na+/H+-dicarboxylate symporter|nr:dicarboxylate/amino acid:cation symporter [Mogibacterium sp.]MBQ9075544.1 dicarboxylate/amino acid:cation symporter [Mogibacterium sp.]